MGKDLVDHWFDDAIVDQVVQVRALEVRYADRSELAGLIGLF
jgi:hypothetical protein